MIELTISKNYKRINEENHLNLSFWDMVFWQNNAVQCNKNEIKDILLTNISEKLEELYDFCKQENFKIVVDNNKELDRAFSHKVEHILQETEYPINDMDELKMQYALQVSLQKYKDYEDTIRILQNSDYEDSFKVLLLNEMLHYSYRTDNSQNTPHLLINPIKLHYSVDGLMNLNKKVLDFLYQNAKDYTSFKKLYLDAQSSIKDDFLQNQNDEYLQNAKGRWIKFDSLKNNKKDFKQNVHNLKALVTGTPWCTDTAARLHLSQGDFYVFVDNHNLPHIAVHMHDDKIDEVRGIKNGNSQEIEEEYRDIVVDFLKNNKDFRDGEKWLEREEWNNRIIKYTQDIENGHFEKNTIPNLMQDIFKIEYKKHGNNKNLITLVESLKKIAPLLSEYMQVGENEICFGDFEAKDLDECPYKIVFGDANFRDSKLHNIDGLQCILGTAHFEYSDIEELNDLKYIGGNAYFYSSKISDLNKLKIVGGCIVLESSNVVDLGELEEVSGDMGLGETYIKSLNKLKKVGGLLDLENSEVEDLGELEEVENINFFGWQGEKLNNLKKIFGYASFGFSKIKSLQNIEYIGEVGYFENSRIEDLGNLKEINGKAQFQKSQIYKEENAKFDKDSDEYSPLIVNAKELQSVKEILVDGEIIPFEEFQKQIALNNQKNKDIEK